MAFRVKIKKVNSANKIRQKNFQRDFCSKVLLIVPAKKQQIGLVKYNVKMFQCDSEICVVY